MHELLRETEIHQLHQDFITSFIPGCLRRPTIPSQSVLLSHLFTFHRSLQKTFLSSEIVTPNTFSGKETTAGVPAGGGAEVPELAEDVCCEG